MYEKNILPDYVLNIFRDSFKIDEYPNIVKTKNINKDGLYTLLNKNKIIWSYSTYLNNEFDYHEGIILWGNKNVIINFKKIEKSLTYKIFIITNNLENIELLLIGLNKFYTIDEI